MHLPAGLRAAAAGRARNAGAAAAAVRGCMQRFVRLAAASLVAAAAGWACKASAVAAATVCCKEACRWCCPKSLAHATACFLCYLQSTSQCTPTSLHSQPLSSLAQTISSIHGGSSAGGSVGGAHSIPLVLPPLAAAGRPAELRTVPLPPHVLFFCTFVPLLTRGAMFRQPLGAASMQCNALMLTQCSWLQQRMAGMATAGRYICCWVAARAVHIEAWHQTSPPHA